MSRSINWLVSIVLLAIPIIVYFSVWSSFAVNIPKWDDHAIKASLLSMQEASTFMDKVKAIFAQHNEHRIALTRFVAWVDYSLFGSLNFRHLMLVGNLLLLIVPLIWALLLNDFKKHLACLVPVLFLWLTMVHWENMYWGMASIQNFGVVVLVVATIYLLLFDKTSYFIGAIVVAFITVFTSGNGLTVLPLGLGILLVSQRWKYAGIWGMISVAFVGLYFLNFHYPSETNPDSKATLLQYFKGYLIFLGSFAESLPFRNKQFICLISGGFLLTTSLTIVYHTLIRVVRNTHSTALNKRADLFCLSVCAFILGTGLIVVYGRTGFGIETLLTSRYKIYSLLLLLVVYLYLVLPIKGSFLKPYVAAISLAALLYNFFSFSYHVVDATNLRHYLTTSKFNWTYEDATLTNTAQYKVGGNLVAEESLYYDEWIQEIPKALAVGQIGTTDGLNQLSKATNITTDSSTIKIANTSYSQQGLQDSGVYLLLASDNRYYLFPTDRDKSVSRKTLYFNQHYFAPGFHHQIDMAELTPANYRIGLVHQQGNNVGIVFQRDSLTVYPRTQQGVRTNW